MSIGKELDPNLALGTWQDPASGYALCFSLRRPQLLETHDVVFCHRCSILLRRHLQWQSFQSPDWAVLSFCRVEYRTAT